MILREVKKLRAQPYASTRRARRDLFNEQTPIQGLQQDVRGGLVVDTRLNEASSGSNEISKFFRAQRRIVSHSGHPNRFEEFA
jgi:hypothetical protein